MEHQTLNKTIAVLGANGRLSREVARAFHAAGWKVRAVTRNGKSPALFNCTGMEFVAADALKREDVIRATKGADFIFNGLNPIYTDWADKAMPMAENVLSAVKANGAVHLFPGNVYNFGTKIPEVLTDDTPSQPDHGKAQIRVRMEQLFADAARKEGLQTIILRAGDFFGGDGSGSWFDLVLASKISKGKFTYPGNAGIVHVWAYLPDLANAFVGLAENADRLNPFEVFHFEGHNVTGTQFHAAAETAVERKLKKSGLPGIVMKIGGLFSPMMREVSEVFYLWEKPHALKDGRFEAVVGTLPRTPLEKAVSDALIGQDLLPGSTALDAELKKLAVT